MEVDEIGAAREGEHRDKDKEERESKGGDSVGDKEEGAEGGMACRVTMLCGVCAGVEGVTALGAPHSLREVTLEQKLAIRAALRASQRWTSSPWVYGLMFTLMLALCILSIVYPARFVSRLVNLGPSTNAADRRKYLSRACTHLTRELVLDDGFSRMTRPELHGALHWHLEELKRVSAAVRLGDGELGISEGADFRNAEHNALMYQNVCPWREDASDCSLPGLPDVEVDGLYSLILHFYEAVEAVMAQYGVELQEAEAAYEAYVKRETEPTEFPAVVIKEERYRRLEEDPNLKLILQSFDGDLYLGYDKVVQAFDHETDSSLDTVHVELRLLFAVYILAVVMIFYGLLFRRTLAATLAEVEQTRAFMFRVPCHALEKTEVEQMRRFFTTSAFRLPPGYTTGWARVFGPKADDDDDTSSQKSQ